MSLTVKLVISLVVAAAASTLVTVLRGDTVPDLLLLSAFALATVITALLVSLPATPATRTPAPAAAAPAQAKRATPLGAPPAGAPAAGAPAAGVPPGPAREGGRVKWFNVTKGFGFIIRDDGGEIFVHFRSIRGEGRRSLREGQRVSFVVAQSDKGPQAEDVVAE